MPAPLSATLGEALASKLATKPPSQKAVPVPAPAHVEAPISKAQPLVLLRRPAIGAPESSPPEVSAEPVAPKKRKRTVYDDAYKAKTVARALKGIESGDESVYGIATELGIPASNITNWIKAAKAANGAPVAAPAEQPKKRSAGSDIQTLSRELAAKLAEAEAIKKKLRKLLED